MTRPMSLIFRLFLFVTSILEPSRVRLGCLAFLGIPVFNFYFNLYCVTLGLDKYYLFNIVLKTHDCFNPFVRNAPFLYPPENIRKPYGFLDFSGGRERVH